MRTTGILLVLQCAIVVTVFSKTIVRRQTPQAQDFDDPPADGCLLSVKECRKWLTAIVPLVSDAITNAQFDQLKQFISDVSLSCKLGSDPPHAEVSLFIARTQQFSPWLTTENNFAQLLSKLTKIDLIQAGNARVAPKELIEQSLALVNRRLNAKEGRYVLLITDQNVDFGGTNPKENASNTGVVFQMIQLPNRQEDSKSAEDAISALQRNLLGDSFQRFQSYDDLLASERKFTPCGQQEPPNNQLSSASFQNTPDFMLQNQSSMPSNQGQLLNFYLSSRPPPPLLFPPPPPPHMPPPPPPPPQPYDERVEIFGMSITSIIIAIIIMIIAFLLGCCFARAQMWRRMTVEARNRTAADNQINRDLEMAISRIDKIDNNISRNINVQATNTA